MIKDFDVSSSQVLSQLSEFSEEFSLSPSLRLSAPPRDTKSVGDGSRGDAEMRRVRLGEVAEEVRGNWAGETKDVPVVGLEHLDPDDIWLRKWEVNPSESTFTKAFRKGQLLFGRRRAYQKKLSLAPSDGICSGDITVIAAKGDKVIPELLPFFLRTDKFFDYAIQGSAGSLSPRVKWAHLANYEFDLPPIERQRELANLLWAANDLKESYKKAITATDEMLKAKFREMFGCGDVSRGDAEERSFQSKWPMVRFDDVAPSRLGKMLDARKQTGKWLRPYLANVNVQWFRFDLSNLREMDFNEEDQQEFALQDGDLLICEGGEVGRCAIWHCQLKECYFQKAIHRVRCDRKKIIPEYVAFWFLIQSQNGLFAKEGKGTTIAHLPGEKLKELKIPLPPLSLQREFVAIAEKADAAKSALKKSIADIEQVMKGLVNG